MQGTRNNYQHVEDLVVPKHLWVGVWPFNSVYEAPHAVCDPSCHQQDRSSRPEAVRHLQQAVLLTCVAPSLVAGALLPSTCHLTRAWG